MNTLPWFALLLLACFCAQTTSAYELTTHGAMTNEAYRRSTLSNLSFIRMLGIDDTVADPFDARYYDVSGGNVYSREVFGDYEGRIIRKVGVPPLSIPGWLMRGAIREDDLGYILGVSSGADPHDDPYGSFFRVFNHFYDPIFNRPLTVGIGFGETAPNWGLGTRDALVAAPLPNPTRRNHFTIVDARESMWRALTGLDGGGNPVAVNERTRNTYLGDYLPRTRRRGASGAGYGAATAYEK